MYRRPGRPFRRRVTSSSQSRPVVTRPLRDPMIHKVGLYVEHNEVFYLTKMETNPIFYCILKRKQLLCTNVRIFAIITEFLPPDPGTDPEAAGRAADLLQPRERGEERGL